MDKINQFGPRSMKAWARAQRILAGGVNSPVRAYQAVGAAPVFIASGKGSRVIDLDGRSYIDYVCSWGPLIAGHAHPRVVEAVCRAAADGTSFGAPTVAETKLAEKIAAKMPVIERIRFVNSGTEAVMSALRLARGFTGRELIVKCIGGYHGHVDGLLARAGSGLATFAAPSSSGVGEGVIRSTRLIPYNDIAAAEALFADEGRRIAALVVEPVAGNMGVIPPGPGYLQRLRELTAESGAVLIFDEVITGFRVAPGGAQALYGVRPDLVCLGKIIGGGLPVGAYGGRAEIMAKLAPEGPVYQAGTLSGNPLAMAAGIATLDLLEEPQVYEKLENLSGRLSSGLAQAAEKAGIAVTLNRVGSMSCCFFTASPVRNYEEANRSDTDRFGRFFRRMLAGGVWLAPSQFEAAFVSLAHTDEDIEKTFQIAESAFAEASG